MIILIWIILILIILILIFPILVILACPSWVSVRLGLGWCWFLVLWPGVLIVWVPAADVHLVSLSSVDTRNERDPESIELWSVCYEVVSYDTIEVTAGLGHTEHGTRTPHIGSLGLTGRLELIGGKRTLW